MIPAKLHGIVNNVLRRARHQGYVVPRDIRDELNNAGISEARWKEVLSAVRPSLHYRQGRYYSLERQSSRLQEQQSRQQVVFHAVSKIIRRHQASKVQDERRRHERVDFIFPIKVRTEDNREFHVLTRDLSPSGIRLLANRSLLGQKLRIQLTLNNGAKPCEFIVRILWTCAVADGLFENGGTFLGMAEEAEK